MHGFVATGRPASAATEELRVIASADKDLADGRLMLEVALQAKRCIALGEKFFVNRAVRAMARDTTLARRLMLVNIRSALLCVAPVTGFVVTHERGAASDDRVALVGGRMKNISHLLLVSLLLLLPSTHAQQTNSTSTTTNTVEAAEPPKTEADYRNWVEFGFGNTWIEGDKAAFMQRWHVTQPSRDASCS